MDEHEILIDQEQARALLRERFLRGISQLNGKACKVKMYECTEVSCTIKAFDPNMETIIVANMQTPLPKSLDYAILRCNDIISLEFNL